MKCREVGESSITRDFIICTLRQVRTIKAIKSKSVRWREHVARMGRRGILTGYWFENRRKYTTRKTKTWVGA
jgi:hypothetical protein